jgi:Autophagy receptor ATG43
MNRAKLRIPDLRFEVSYRRAITPANGSWWKIALITVRDQVFMPFTQGFVWSFLLIGLRTWRVLWSQNGAMWGGRFYQANTI